MKHGSGRWLHFSNLRMGSRTLTCSLKASNGSISSEVWKGATRSQLSGLQSMCTIPRLLWRGPQHKRQVHRYKKGHSDSIKKHDLYLYSVDLLVQVVQGLDHPAGELLYNGKRQAHAQAPDVLPYNAR